jgi:hypothetical protein
VRSHCLLSCSNCDIEDEGEGEVEAEGEVFTK